LVWIGNWGDDERAESLRELLIRPVRQLGLRACVYGVRYPDAALRELAAAGIEYAGWLPNYRVGEVFGRYRVTIHVPRRPYVEALPGIPTIRPFEAMGCGIPLVSGPWTDSEHLFRAGEDFLFARTQEEMISQLELLLSDDRQRSRQIQSGLETILSRHTCAHRVDELLSFVTSPVLTGGSRGGP
jgi:spore maturation protein CgeB